MQELVTQRKSKSGKEHGLTLWAIANLARVKSARGDHSEAEADFKVGIPTVEQNFGEEHIGTLYGKTYLSHVLISEQKYDEAQSVLIGVIDIHQKLRPSHPDQLVGLSFLLKLYRIEAGLDAINQRGHAWERQLFDAWIPARRRTDVLHNDFGSRRCRAASLSAGAEVEQGMSFRAH
jgi:hypothetical protein